MDDKKYKVGEKRGVARADSFIAYSFLDREEYRRLTDEQRELRMQIAEINRQLSNSGWVHPSKRTELEQRREGIFSRWEELNTILGAAERSRRDVAKERATRLKGNDIVQIIVAARELIEQLQEQLGDHWTDEQRMLCGELKYLTGLKSPLNHMINRDEMNTEIESLKKQHSLEIARERRASQQAVGILKSQIRDLQDKRGRAAIILDRLYTDRYQEIDEFRKARGVSHRIHLTAADCREIEEAIKG